MGRRILNGDNTAIAQSHRRTPAGEGVVWAMRHVRLAKRHAGTAAVVLAGVGFLSLSIFLGTFRPFLVVQGTSMEPVYHRGDLLLLEDVPTNEIVVGDIIVFGVPEEARKRLKMPSNAAHRVVERTEEAGVLTFVTKGDNSGTDPFSVPATAVRGAIWKNLGPIGLPGLIVKSPAVLVVGLPILTFAVVVLASLWLLPGGSTSDGQTAPSADFGDALTNLGVAVNEYGAHLKSHTNIVKHMAVTSDGLEEAVQLQTQILADLAVAVRQLAHKSK